MLAADTPSQALIGVCRLDEQDADRDVESLYLLNLAAENFAEWNSLEVEEAFGDL